MVGRLVWLAVKTIAMIAKPPIIGAPTSHTHLLQL
jgi:hypothetical protein